MNYFMTLLSLIFTFTLSVQSLNAVKVNGQDTTEDFVYENPSSTHHIAFKFDANGIAVGSLQHVDAQIPQLLNNATQIKPQLGKFTSGQGIKLTTPHFQGQLLTGQSVELTGTPDLEVQSCIIESPKVLLTADKLTCNNTFIQSANPVHFTPRTPTALVKDIQFIPIDADKPMLVQGKLNFTSFQTTDFFIVTGTRKVSIKLK